MTRGKVFSLLAVLVLSACDGAPPEETLRRKNAWPELLTVPHPTLDTAEEAARENLEARRTELFGLLYRRETPPAQLGEAFGRMGNLYHAYDLPEAARACYGNARALQPEEPRWPYSEGLLQAQAGRIEEAEARFGEALRLRPEDGAAHLHRGDVLLSLGRAEEALHEFEQAQDSGESFGTAALFGIGRAQAALGLSAEAVVSLRRARELAPRAGALRYPLARALQKLGKSEEAREVLAEGGSGAVSFPDPRADEIRDLASSSAALVARGGEALVAGHLEQAEDLYRRAMKVGPSNIEARRNLAVVLGRSDQNAEAVKVLEAALRLEPNHALVALDLANARLASGDLEGAIDSFRRCLKAAPDLEAAHFNLANALMQAQSWAAAEESLRRVLELSPENLEATYLLAMARFQQDQSQESLEGLRQVVRKNPSMTAARLSLASILAQTGRLDQARRHYVAILDQAPAQPLDRSTAYSQLAALSLRQGKEAEAESQLEEALKILPGNEAATTALVELLKRQGRSKEVRRVFEDWARNRPGSIPAQLGWAQARMATGNYLEARGILEKALESHPRDASLTHALARLLATAPEPSARDGARALVLAQEAYLAHRSLDHAETLAMAMAESGDFAEAVRWQGGLLKQAQGMGKPALVRRIEENLKFYEAGTPVRAAPDGSGE